MRNPAIQAARDLKAIRLRQARRRERDARKTHSYNTLHLQYHATYLLKPCYDLQETYSSYT